MASSSSERNPVERLAEEFAAAAAEESRYGCAGGS
jgi:hypothetical protein